MHLVDVVVGDAEEERLVDEGDLGPALSADDDAEAREGFLDPGKQVFSEGAADGQVAYFPASIRVDGALAFEDDEEAVLLRFGLALEQLAHLRVFLEESVESVGLASA